MTVTAQGEPDLAEQIAAALGETTPVPRRQIADLIQRFGDTQARTWLEQAQHIEAAGGMPTKNGQRRRTPGGVFFKLVKDELLRTNRKDDVYEVFWKDRPKPKGKGAGQSAPAPASISWNDRGAAVSETTGKSGKATTVKCTVIGKPSKVVERPGFALLRLEHSGPLPSLPKGIPVPSKVPTTTYLVYIGSKQWNKVRDALKNPEDVLIAEGTQIYDEPFKAIAVFTTNATTKLLQQAQKAAPKPAEG